jgi:hypothetical protein
MQIQQTQELQTQNLSLTQQNTTQAQVINQLQNQLAILQQQNQQLQTAALYPTAPNFAALPSTPTFAALPPPPQPAPAENANGTQRRRRENRQRMANTIPGGQQEGPQGGQPGPSGSGSAPNQGAKRPRVDITDNPVYQQMMSKPTLQDRIVYLKAVRASNQISKSLYDELVSIVSSDNQMSD